MYLQVILTLNFNVLLNRNQLSPTGVAEHASVLDGRGGRGGDRGGLSSHFRSRLLRLTTIGLLEMNEMQNRLSHYLLDIFPVILS